MSTPKKSTKSTKSETARPKPMSPKAGLKPGRKYKCGGRLK